MVLALGVHRLAGANWAMPLADGYDNLDQRDTILATTILAANMFQVSRLRRRMGAGFRLVLFACG
jgi:hypothetical protein